MMNWQKKYSFSTLSGLLLASVLVFSGVSETQAQKNKTNTSTTSSTSADPNAEHYWQIYRLAQQYGDASVAINAMYHVLALQPDDLAVKDTLASLYFTSGFMAQALVLANEILKSTPDNTKMLELSAIAYGSLGLLKESVSQYERLFALTQSPYHLYQLAIQQYSLKRYEECALSLNRLIADPKSMEEKITIDSDQRTKQLVILKAAALNVLGVAHRDLNKNDAAKNYFEQAIKVDPEFVLPKNNLADMEKK